MEVEPEGGGLRYVDDDILIFGDSIPHNSVERSQLPKVRKLI